MLKGFNSIQGFHPVCWSAYSANSMDDNMYFPI